MGFCTLCRKNVEPGDIFVLWAGRQYHSKCMLAAEAAEREALESKNI